MLRALECWCEWLNANCIPCTTWVDDGMPTGVQDYKAILYSKCKIYMTMDLPRYVYLFYKGLVFNLAPVAPNFSFLT